MQFSTARLEPFRPPLPAHPERSASTCCADLEQMPLASLLYYVLTEHTEKPRN
jgi:hypothetical protein